MSAESWDWSLRVFDHVDVHASDYAESVHFYEVIYRDVGNVGHEAGPTLR